MSFKKTFIIAALAFWAGTHYSPKFYEELEKREEDDRVDGDFIIDEMDSEGPWTKWASTYELTQKVRTKLLDWYPSKDPNDNEPVPLTQAESAQIYLNAFDKGYKAASTDKQNVAKQYKKFFGDVTAEEVQSEMRGG